MEKKKYITYNPRIISRLEDLGFKRKNRDWFCRQVSKDICQELVFGHSTKGIPHAKYYAINAVIKLPEVLKMAQKLDICTLTCFENINLGYFKPERHYLEWLVTEDSDEKYDNDVVNSMLCHIEKYAIPFLNKFCSTSAIVKGIKECAYPDRYGTDNMLTCITLLMYGTKEDFLWFVEKRSHEMQYDIFDSSVVHWDYRHPQEPLTEPCEYFLENVEKLKPLMEEKGITW